MLVFPESCTVQNKGHWPLVASEHFKYGSSKSRYTVKSHKHTGFPRLSTEKSKNLSNLWIYVETIPFLHMGLKNTVIKINLNCFVSFSCGYKILSYICGSHYISIIQCYCNNLHNCYPKETEKDSSREHHDRLQRTESKEYFQIVGISSLKSKLYLS